MAQAGTNEINLQGCEFSRLYASGSVRSIVIVFEIDGWRCTIQYTHEDGRPGFVVTDQGDVQLFRIDSALSFLNSIGVGTVKVDLVQYLPESRLQAA